MATATIEITLPGLTGFTLTLDLYPLGSDTAAASSLTLTEATNRKCTYTTTTNAGLTGAYLAVAKEGSTVQGAGYVAMTDTENVHVVGIDLPGKVLGGGSGTISGVGARVAVASDGLDAVSITAPSGVASNFREMVVQVWRRFFMKATQTDSQIKTYANDGSTVVTTQTVSDDGTTETQGAAS